ncbi:MAG TPA: hypothetical protein VFJ91_01090 [Gaiellaceae bacterium]|nr:hypothetical protein [Gaiellaceae bacterium]
MGGNRPMTLARALSLLVLVGGLLGVATGLSHVGHDTRSKCNGTWAVLVGHAADQVDAATINNRASQMVASDCYGSIENPKGGWDAIATFHDPADANAFLQQLVAAGYPDTWHVQPSVEQVQPASPTSR